MRKLYLIGSLRSEEIPHIANRIEEGTGIEVFTDWWAPGRRADDFWKEYCQARGWSYREALQRPAATHIWEFDHHHIEDSDGCILILPAGMSCGIEFGYFRGLNKPGWILLDDPERWDVMLQYATDIADSEEALIEMIKDWDKWQIGVRGS